MTGDPLPISDGAGGMNGTNSPCRGGDGPRRGESGATGGITGRVSGGMKGTGIGIEPAACDAVPGLGMTGTWGGCACG